MSRKARLLDHAGESLTRSQWASKLGISRKALEYRLKNWSLEKALTIGPSMGVHHKRQRKFTSDQISEIRSWWSQRCSIRGMARRYGVSVSMIEKIGKGFVYKEST